MILFTRAIRSQYPHIPFAHSGTIGLSKGATAYTPLVRAVINKEIIKKKIKEYLIFIIAFIMLNKKIYSDFFFSFISKFFTLGVRLFLLSAIFLLRFVCLFSYCPQIFFQILFQLVFSPRTQTVFSSRKFLLCPTLRFLYSSYF